MGFFVVEIRNTAVCLIFISHTVNTVGLLTPPLSPPFKPFAILDNGVSPDPIEARLPWYLPSSRQILDSPVEDLATFRVTSAPFRPERDSTPSSLGIAALPSSELEQLAACDASQKVSTISSQDSQLVDPAGVAVRSSHRRGRHATTSEDGIARAAEIYRQEVRCSSHMEAQISDAELYKTWYRSLLGGVG